MKKTLNEKLLEENLLRSDFTFGFELEGCASYDYYDSYSNEYSEYDSPEYDLERHNGNEVTGELAKAIDDNLNKLMNADVSKDRLKYGEIENDVSIEPDNDDDYTFEWASPVLECTPYNFNRVIKMLSSLESIGIYTNESCGIHHHLSYKGITEREMIWIYVNLCMDTEFRDFMSTVDGYELTSSEWASSSTLDDIAEAIKEKNYTRVLRALSDDKYRLFRIHPYGTIEWRGPRNFLDSNDFKIIKDFYKKFNTYINKVIEYQDNKVIFGTDITKKEFFDNLVKAKDENPNRDRELEFLVRTHGYNDRPLQYKTEKGSVPSKKLIEKLWDKPELLYKFVYQDSDLVESLYMQDKSTVQSAAEKLYNNGVYGHKIPNPKEFAEKLFNIYSSTSSIEETIRALGDWVGYLDFEDIIQSYGNNVNYIKVLAFVLKARKLEYKKLYNTLVNVYHSNANLQLNRNDVLSLKAIIEYLPLRDYTPQEEFSILNAVVKILYRSNTDMPPSWLNMFTGIVESTIEQVMSPEQIKQWNNGIISAIYSKNEMSWMIALLDENYVDIKSLIALTSRYPDVYIYLDPMIKRKINPYLQKGIINDD